MTIIKIIDIIKITYNFNNNVQGGNNNNKISLVLQRAPAGPGPERAHPGVAPVPVHAGAAGAQGVVSVMIK